MLKFCAYSLSQKFKFKKFIIDNKFSKLSWDSYLVYFSIYQ